MSWTATLKVFEQRSGQWNIVLLYTDTVNGTEFLRKYVRPNITKKQLRELARSEVTRLVQAEANDVDIPLGATIDITPEPVVNPDPPTQAELDKRAWFEDYGKLRSYKRLLDHGVSPTGIDAQISTLQASLLADWDNSYASNL